MKTGFLVGGIVVGIVSLVMIILGFSANGMVNNQIASTLEGIVTEGPDPVQEPSTQSYSYFVFNITNALEVQNGKKPIVQEIKVTATKTELKYDVLVDEAADTYGYRSYTTITPDNEADWDQEIVALNIFYAGVALSQTSSELGFQAFLTSGLWESFLAPLEKDGLFLSGFKVLGIPKWVLGLFSSVNATVAATQGEGSGEDAGSGLGNPANWWTGAAGSLSSVMGPLAAAAAGWQPATPLLDPNAGLIFFSEGNLSVLTDDGIMRWANSLPNGTDAKTLETLAIANDMAMAGYNQSYIQADMTAISEWLGGLLTTNGEAYFTATRDQLVAAQFPDVAACTSWEDLGLMQFSQSVLTFASGFGGTIGVMQEPPSPAFEFRAWQDSAGVSGAERAILNLNQTKEFFNAFGEPASIGLFLYMANLAAGAATAGDIATATGYLKSYEKVGVTLSNVATFVTYMGNYLPETFVLAGAFQQVPAPGGDGSTPSGLFIRRTIREFLFGWTDALIEFTGEEHNGFISSVANLTVARSRDIEKGVNGTRDTYILGKKNIEDIGKYVEIDGIRKFSDVTDLRGKCPIDFVWGTACKVWESEELIQGTHSLQLPPAKEGADPVATFGAYVDELKRTVNWKFTEEIQLKGIDLHKYEMNWQDLMSEEDLIAAGASAGAIANAKKHLMTDTGFGDMSRLNGQVPVYLSLPRALTVPTQTEERAKIAGLTTADWEDGDEKADSLGTYVAVEPLTGNAMFGVKRLQANLRLDKASWTGFYRNMWFGGEGSDHVFFPLYWEEDADGADDTLAASFVEEVYGAQDTGKNIGIALPIVGFLLLVVAAGLVFFAMKEETSGGNKQIELS